MADLDTKKLSSNTHTTITKIAPDSGRRKLIQTIGAAGIYSLVDPLVKSGAWAAGSDAPEKTDVKISFIALTDCSSVVMANHLGLDKKYGIKIIPTKEASWAAIRDKLINGENDLSHILYGLVYGLQMGIGGQQKDMSVLMSLNHNGQAISLSKALYQKGVTEGASLKALMDKEKRDYTFAQTFPTGTHAMWLYYWLANYGINPFKDAKLLGRSLLVPFSKPPLELQASSKAICNCFNVKEDTMKDLLSACHPPLVSVAEGMAMLQEKTLCGTNCGSCKPEVKQLILKHFQAQPVA